MLTALMGGELTVTSAPGAGSVFQVKLFLPEVHADVPAKLPPTLATAARPHRVRTGYEGERRRILVVDNEEPDRELLRHLLEPLGFELRQTASGHDALDLLATGYRPHAIFMDLAMPGIDGWETLRRVRQMHLAEVHCAIVSANAFDKTLDNDMDIVPEDFIVKPVRHSELLDWLERRLGLQWQYDEAANVPVGSAPKAVAAAPALLTYPDAMALAALAQVVALGYYRGILNTLDDIERSQPAHSAFVGTMRQLAKQFQFDAMGRILEQARP